MLKAESQLDCHSLGVGPLNGGDAFQQSVEKEPRGSQRRRNCRERYRQGLIIHHCCYPSHKAIRQVAF